MRIRATHPLECTSGPARACVQVADARFPVGKARLETLGVLGCASLMSVAAYVVVQDASLSLWAGLFDGARPDGGVEVCVLTHAWKSVRARTCSTLARAT